MTGPVLVVKVHDRPVGVPRPGDDEGDLSRPRCPILYVHIHHLWALCEALRV